MKLIPVTVTVNIDGMRPGEYAEIPEDRARALIAGGLAIEVPALDAPRP